jgi:hypothetical protein
MRRIYRTHKKAVDDYCVLSVTEGARWTGLQESIFACVWLVDYFYDTIQRCAQAIDFKGELLALSDAVIQDLACLRQAKLVECKVGHSIKNVPYSPCFAKYTC